MTPAERLATAVEQLAALTAGRPITGRGHDDADEVHGTAATDDAIGFDPRPLLAALAAAGAEVVVIGQVAGILHGSVEPTGDLDLLWSGDSGQAAALAAAFAAVGAALSDDDGRPVRLDAAAFTRPKVQYRSEQASGDCCTPALPWGTLDVAGMLARADAATVGGATVRYVCRADLIAMRRAVGRPKDLRRAAELERTTVGPSGPAPRLHP